MSPPRFYPFVAPVGGTFLPDFKLWDYRDHDHTPGVREALARMFRLAEPGAVVLRPLWTMRDWDGNGTTVAMVLVGTWGFNVAVEESDYRAGLLPGDLQGLSRTTNVPARRVSFELAGAILARAALLLSGAEPLPAAGAPEATP